MSYSNLFIYIKNNLETKVLLFFGIGFVVAFYSLCFFSLWTETEIYPTHSSQYLFTEEGSNFLFALKPIFYLILHLSFLFSDFLNLFPMTTARFIFAINGLASLVFMYLYIKQKTCRYNAVLAVLTLAGSNIFLDRGFRVRSDLLCSSLSLMALVLLLNVKVHKGNLKFYLVIPLLFSLLLVTPKGIYWVFFTLCLMLYDLKHEQFPSLKDLAKTIAVVCMAFVGISFIFKDPLFLQSLKSSTQFFLLNIQQTWQFVFEKGWLKSLNDISHIGFFLERNLFLVLIIGLKCVFVVYSTVIRKKRSWDLSDIYFGLLFLILLFHPQSKLFFLCAIMPFFLIAFFTDYQWNQYLSRSYRLTFKTFFFNRSFFIQRFLYSLFQL